MQNHGRPCTQHEEARPYLRRTPESMTWHVDQLAIQGNSSFVVPVRSPRFLNPGLISYNHSLWLFMRNQLMSNEWDLCPENSLYSVFPCPELAKVDHYRMISFVVFCKVDADMQISSEVRGIDYELDYTAIVRASEPEFGPEV